MRLNLSMGARNGAKTQREANDFYATNPEAVELFLDRIKNDTDFRLHHDIWECACGQGHISKVFKQRGYNVLSSDLIDRGCKDSFIIDFLNEGYNPNIYRPRDIITNPPFKYATKFAYKALERVDNDYYVAFFLKLQFLESTERRKLFDEYPPKFIYVYSNRQQCSMNADFENLKARTLAYCWVVWQKGFSGETITRWI